MKTKKDRAEYLADKWLNKNITPEEEMEFHAWYSKDLYKSLELPSDFAGSEQEHRLRMLKVIQNSIKRPVKKLWPRFGIAAAVATIIVSAGIWFLNRPPLPDQVEQSVKTNDVLPGTVGATLTLANGKKIKLSDASNGKLAQESGVTITKSADGQLVYEIKRSASETDKINTLSTGKGETYQVKLPDGSLVYLNAASSLTYTSSLIERGKRTVRLRGEGYFEISKDKKHPFVVHTDNQEVEVLGTHFNINSYGDELNTATTLLEGSVRITAGNSEQILQPGQQALNNGNTINVSEADIETVTDWKNGDFFLNRVDFRTAMRKISRWYNVEVVFDKSVPADIKSSGYISRSNKLSAVLKSIENSGQVHFRVEGRKIYVAK